VVVGGVSIAQKSKGKEGKKVFNKERTFEQ
jgi:hypothetical protein